MKRVIFFFAVVLGFAVGSLAQKSPNVVLIFPDNLGIGEVSAYGSVRAVATPNIDQIGKDGIRLTNFNVEYSCVPSRAAIMTGRYATRTGENYFADGLTLWEATLAEALRVQGYATGLFGKWDLGGDDWEGKREPTQQGFDEWYGIPHTSNVAQYETFEGYEATGEPIPYVWQGTAGTPSQRVKPFNIQARRTIDREAAEKAIGFIERNAKKAKPFFVYYPMTQVHFPTLPHPDKAGTTGAGDLGDAMADVDYNVGLILKALKNAGVDNNTLVIWCSDNGAEMRRPWRGSSGPWRGFYNSALEGGIRTPCVIRWPGKIKPGQVSNEIVHEVDLFPTIAAAVGAQGSVPGDRLMDGVSQLSLLMGKETQSTRESAIYLTGNGKLMAIKWNDWKIWYNYKTEIPDPNPDNLFRLFNLRADPTEETDVKDHYPWVISIADGIAAAYENSLVQHPRVPAKQIDPYTPPAVGSGKRIQVYSRTDRDVSKERTEALPKPDFTGAWSTTVLETRNVLNINPTTAMPTLGSGWGDKISIKLGADFLEVERVIFAPRDAQSLVRYRYALNGAQTENAVNTGMTGKAPTSTSAWQGNRLVITTLYPYQTSKNGEWLTYTVTQTLWLSAGTAAPWEPVLLVETTREAAKGGLPSTTRTTYVRGHR